MRPLTPIERTTDRTAEVRLLLASCSAAAGVIHAAVVPEHLGEAMIFGVFFILVAGFQISWAIPVVVGPSGIVFVAGVLGNGALIGLWAVSRTVGLPIGPEPWMAEPAGMLDVTATVLELLLVAGSLVLRARLHADGLGAVDSMRPKPVRAQPRRVGLAKSRNRPETTEILKQEMVELALGQTVRSRMLEGKERS